MNNRFSIIKLRLVLLCFFLTCVGFQTIFAFETDKTAEVIQKENKAKRLSKEWSGEKIRRSIVLYKEVVEQWETLGEFKNATANLREATKLAEMLSDYKTALALLNKALKIDEKINHTDGKIISLSLLSQISRQKGEIKQSENYYKQAVKLSTRSRDALAKAYAFYSAGKYSAYYGDTNTTLKLLEKALSYATKTVDKPLTAQIHRDLGWAYFRDGKPDKELENAKESLRLSVETENKREQALSYYSIGNHYVLVNEKQIALNYLKKAEKNFPTDIDQIHKARIDTTIAYIYEIYGELDIAEKYYKDALGLYEKAKFPSGVLTSLVLLAEIKEMKGETLAVEELHKRALQLAKELNNEFRIGVIKKDFGNIALKNGDYDLAIKYYQEAITINRKLKIELPLIQNGLGKAFELKGELQIAQENYEKALKRNLEIKDYSLAAENLYNLARLYLSLGNTDKALEYSNRSIEITESTYTNVDNNKLRRTFLSNIYDRYSLNIHLLMKMHERFPEKGYDLKALQMSERSRSRSLLENLRLSEAEFMADAESGLVATEKMTRESLNENAEKLTRSLTSGATKDEIKKIETKINELKNELEKIKGELKSKSPIYSTIKNPKDFDVQEFQENVLDEDSLFLEFSFGENESYLWLIGKNSLDVIVLPERKILEDGLNEIYDLLISREVLEDESDADYQNRISENEKKFQKHAQILSNQLLGKVADKLKDKRLIFTTDGKLRYFPVSALPFPSNNKTTEIINAPILLTNEIVYEPSATTLSLLTQKINSAKTPEKDLLIFADAVYSANDERINLNRSDVSRSASSGDDLLGQTSFLRRLPATEQEAESIVQTFGWSDTKLFSGFSATRENFFDANLSDYKVLHFATHGLLNERHPEFSSLVFSQFDKNGKKQKGIVRLQDIYGLNLQADLVVLSACDTGIGKDIKGEGLVSLTNGFLQSGAKTVVSSRWKVSDQATLRLMKNFYEIMKAENLPPSKALQKAKVKLRQNPAFASPYHWAAFTIQGDYENKPNISNGFEFSKYLLMLISFLVIVGVYFILKKLR